MGFYYGQGQPEPEEKPPGCMDAIIVTRAVFGVLMWPMVALIGVVLDLSLMIWAFSIHPALILLPVGLTALAIWLFARWDQGRFGPKDLE